MIKLPETFSPDGKLLNVVIETPAGNRNKYAYDPQTGLFRLRKILPVVTEFPLDKKLRVLGRNKPRNALSVIKKQLNG